MLYAEVNQNGTIVNLIESRVQLPNTLDTSALTPWQLKNSAFITWNGSTWIVDPNLPAQPVPETNAAKRARATTFLQGKGFTATQASGLITMLQEFISQLS